MPKTIFAILATVVANALIHAGPAHAQNYPWCAQRADGSSTCGFVSYEQCMAAGRWCNENPLYQPPAGEARSRRLLRGRPG